EWVCRPLNQPAEAAVQCLQDKNPRGFGLLQLDRPQIHDSDRLSMWLGNGEWVCRPLNQPAEAAVQCLQDKNPRGFGLLQLDR
ncbi:hypothetical protein CK247_30250, partial [Klebsiella pneumoniae]